MTEVLGNKLCVESLSKDVGDIQKALGNMTSRLGHMSYTSWKYPDKLASEIDIADLLEMCEYDAEYDEENKISHLLLLELVIDRLIFFIQCSYRYLDLVGPSARAPSVVDSKSSSVGSATKKYWSRLLQLQSTIQQLVSDPQLQSKKIKELESYNHELQQELGKYHEGVVKVPTSGSSVYKAEVSTVPPASQIIDSSIAQDNSNKASQTLQTAFVPCEYCHKVQASLKSVGDSVSHMCKTQGVMSSLSKFRKKLKGVDWYSANDLTRWSVEQEKDIDRLNKHLKDLMDTINPLKEELTSSITMCRSLEKRITEFQREIELEKESFRSQQKLHSAQVDDLNKSHLNVKTTLEQQNVTLEEGRKILEQKLTETKCELELQKSQFKELDEVKQQLMADLEISKADEREVKRLNSIVSSLEQEMDQTMGKLKDAEVQLSQERAVSKSLSKRTESVQLKFDSLVRRMDEMDEENNELQAELSSMVEEKEKLIAHSTQTRQSESDKVLLQQVETEKKELKKKIMKLETQVTELEKELSQVRERERLMVEYPDLNGPVNSDIQGTGDIVVDMSNQVQANQIRIDLLEQQNINMKKTIKKLNGSDMAVQHDDTTPQYDSVSPMEPTRLWQQTSLAKEVNHRDSRPSSSQRSYEPKKEKGHGAIMVGPGCTNNRRPRSSTHHDTASMDAYMKLKKAGLLK